jgi:cell division protease FtsH
VDERNVQGGHAMKSGAITFVVLLVGLLMAAAVTALISFATSPGAPSLSLSELARMVKSEQIASIDVSGDSAVVKTRDQMTFGVRVGHDGSLPTLLQTFGVTPDELTEVSYRVQSPPASGMLLSAAGAVAPALLVGGLLLLMMRRSGSPSSEVFSFGKTRARVLDINRPRITFEDVAGVDEAKFELQEVVEFLKFPETFTALGARMPRGVLLVGPPGTGKTLLARAVAGEAGVPFFSISASQFVEMFVGVGASRVRDLFEQAKREAPCIVFVDEIDAVGRRRGARVGAGNDEREQTLNQILVEMDGFESDAKVIVLAATNRSDVLDEALLRPGRFDRHIQVPPPDVRGREAVLRVHARGKPVDPRVDLGALARSTPGLSGADLANVINEAAILAARRRTASIASTDLDEAVDRVLGGPAAESRLMSEQERRLTAYHEAGHAVVARYVEHHDPVHKITIIGRGQAGGYTRFLPTQDRNYQTRSQFEASIASALGGHVAETVVFGEMSTGASSDLERATALARRMVMEYGMSTRLGVVRFGSNSEDPLFGGQSRQYSEQTAHAIDEEVRQLLDDAYARARHIIVEYREVLDRLAGALLQWETLQGELLERAFTGGSDEPGSVAVQESPAAGEVEAQPAASRIEQARELSSEPRCKEVMYGHGN